MINGSVVREEGVGIARMKDGLWCGVTFTDSLQWSQVRDFGRKICFDGDGAGAGGFSLSPCMGYNVVGKLVQTRKPTRRPSGMILLLVAFFRPGMVVAADNGPAAKKS